MDCKPIDAIVGIAGIDSDQDIARIRAANEGIHIREGTGQSNGRVVLQVEGDRSKQVIAVIQAAAARATVQIGLRRGVQPEIVAARTTDQVLDLEPAVGYAVAKTIVDAQAGRAGGGDAQVEGQV